MNQELLVKAEAIKRRQRTGKITQWQAAAEFDALLDQETGDLHFYSDTTCYRDTWEGEEVMVFHQSNGQPSNTGIITQGKRRGHVVLRPGAVESDAAPGHLAHFGSPGNIVRT